MVELANELMFIEIFVITPHQLGAKGESTLIAPIVSILRGIKFLFQINNFYS